MTADILDLIEGLQDGDLQAARKLAESWRRRYSGRIAVLLTHSGSGPHGIA
jgi:hypothetical protein